MNGVTVLLIAAISLVLLVALVLFVGIKRSPGRFYQRRKELFTPNDAALLARLDEALGDSYRVLPRVGVPQIAAVRPRMSRRTQAYARDRIAGEHFDFLLVDGQSLTPVAALLVEPGEPTRHERRRMVFQEKLCAAIGLPLVRLFFHGDDDPEHLRRQVELALDGGARTGSAGPDREPRIS